MEKKQSPKSVTDFLRIMPVNAKMEATIECIDSGHGREFFGDFKDAEIVSISVLRYSTFDVIAFVTSDARAIAVVGKKDSFVALEKGKGLEGVGVSMTLGFRDDVSHKRLDIIGSMVSGRDVIYKEDSPKPKDLVEVDPASDFVQLAFKDGPVKSFKISTIEPTWWTEDWFTIRQENYEKLVVRADKEGILGAFAISSTRIRQLSLGANAVVDAARLNQPPQGILPSRILPRK